MKTTQEMIEVMQAHLDGKEIEYRYNNNPDWMKSTVPLWDWPHIDYRVKEQKKVVDLSVLLASGIDCEFVDDKTDSTWFVGKLKRILSDSRKHIYEKDSGASWKYCRPRMNHWHSWQGGQCPLPEGFEVEVLFQDGSRCVGVTTRFRWAYLNTVSDIIAFRVINLAANYCYPWEQE